MYNENEKMKKSIVSGQELIPALQTEEKSYKYNEYE